MLWSGERVIRLDGRLSVYTRQGRGASRSAALGHIKNKREVFVCLLAVLLCVCVMLLGTLVDRGEKGALMPRDQGAKHSAKS